MATDTDNKNPEVGTVIRMEDLVPFFSLHVKYPKPGFDIFLDGGNYNLAKAISYLFQVPLPELDGSRYPWCCYFTGDDVAKIQKQVVGADMKCLTHGRIPLGTLLLLTNSPRFPYTLHISRANSNSDIPTYYDFILKKDIVIKEI